MPDDLMTLPQRFFGGQDELKGPLPSDLCADDYTANIVGFPSMNREGHAEFGRAFYAGFPDIFHTILDTFVSGNRVATRFRLRGTHSGNFMGIPPTGKPVEVDAFVFLTVNEGKVARLDATFDQMGLMRQIGVIQ